MMRTTMMMMMTTTYELNLIHVTRSRCDENQVLFLLLARYVPNVAKRSI